MDDSVEISEVGRRLRHRWWIPVLLAIVGATAGVFATGHVQEVQRARASVMVGSLDSSVSKSSTLNASKDLASFYADMARRQVVLQKVAAGLTPAPAWQDLLGQVSAVVADTNTRIVTITTTAATRARAEAIAQGVVTQLLALAPSHAASTDRQFVTGQVADVRTQITRTEQRVGRLRTLLLGTREVTERARISGQLAIALKMLDDLRHTYASLLSLDVPSGAAALSVVDGVRPTHGLDRAGLVTQGGAGAAAGLLLGLLLALTARRRDPGRRQRRSDPRRTDPQPDQTAPDRPRPVSDDWTAPDRVAEMPRRRQKQPAARP